MSYQQSKLVDEYIERYDAETKRRLQKLRKTIQAAFPKTIEDISYGMPTYRPLPKKRGIVHFANSKKHIGIYGVFEHRNNATYQKLQMKYRTGRGTLQFPSDEPFPIEDIRKILTYHASLFPPETFTNKK